MSLDSILDHIVSESLHDKYEIVKVARTEAADIIAKAEEDARLIYAAAIEKARARAEAEKKRMIVAANLEGRKKILKARQSFVELVFNKAASGFGEDILKKEQITRTAVREARADLQLCMERIKFAHEIDVAKILFE